MRVCEIRFSDPEIPFEAASVLLSYIAYPSNTDEQLEFFRVLCRWEHRAATLRNPEWRSSPKLIRPDFLFGEISDRDVRKKINNLMLRIATCAAILYPQLNHIDQPDLPMSWNNPTVANISRNISSKSKKSESRVIADVWAPAKPVAHLAYAYWSCVLDERWKNDPGFATQSPGQMLTPLADQEQLLGVINHAESIRRDLLELPGSRFDERDMIKFTACGAPTLNK
jgi:hypothetical protein